MKNISLSQTSQTILSQTLSRIQPDKALEDALSSIQLPKSFYLVAIGKASWALAHKASELFGNRIQKGIVITKYNHSKGDIPNMDIYEAGHPVLDQNGIKATEAVLDLVKHLKETDTLLFLITGGGSALFESPMIPLEELQEINEKLLSSGASIQEINTIRKHLSFVKGGRFAKLCEPAKVITLAISDVLGNDPSMIASGPSVVDSSTLTDVMDILNRYEINLSLDALSKIQQPLPKHITNSSFQIISSIQDLIHHAMDVCKENGFTPILLTDSLTKEVKDASSYFHQEILNHIDSDQDIALIMAGEMVVEVKGNGKGGRNQELALRLAKPISGIENVAIISFGSDGTDGPTDAAGGYVDGYSYDDLKEKGYDVEAELENNNSYPLLKEIDGLLFTGPTGTNINDISIALIQKKGIR